MLETDLPVIASVGGAAVGFGAELLALCDIVVMAEDAFLSDPHVAYGLNPSPACQLVWPYLTSIGVAKELLMSGRRVGAAEARAAGTGQPDHPTGRRADRGATYRRGAGWTFRSSGIVSAKRGFNRPLVEQYRREASNHHG